MNIFGIEYDPERKNPFPEAVESAVAQCDKHIVKMPLESAQMLCSAHRILDGNEGNEDLYKIAHPKHPSTLWTMETMGNYNWHYAHWVALCEEYTYRYGKVHLSEKKFRARLCVPPVNIPKGTVTPFRLAFKEHPECIVEGDPVQSYRNFYQTKQDRFNMVWSKRQAPTWFRLTTQGA
tara:strand:- start:1964 stop:2497 length:534 start_codon:yes stop_codon:yes gene_type:complete